MKSTSSCIQGKEVTFFFGFVIFIRLIFVRGLSQKFVDYCCNFSFFERLKLFLYKIQSGHIRFESHKYYFDTLSYVAKPRFHSDQGNAYRRMGKSCSL